MQTCRTQGLFLDYFAIYVPSNEPEQVFQGKRLLLRLFRLFRLFRKPGNFQKSGSCHQKGKAEAVNDCLYK